MRKDSETTRQPGGPVLPNQPSGFNPVAEAKGLLRGIRAGALATLDRESGYPFATLVSVATDVDGAPLLLMSQLSAHTRNIEADPRVSLLLSRGGKGDPLAHPRLTVVGRCRAVAEDRPRSRFLARHPKAALYAGFGDFAFYRVTPEGGHLNGGFARAARLSAEELLTGLDDAAALVAAEPSAVEHMNADHADAVSLYATKLLGLRSGRWVVTGIDPEGLDLMLREETARLPFRERITSPGDLRLALKHLADAARAAP
jgi:putative heme iron utilization protein